MLTPVRAIHPVSPESDEVIVVCESEGQPLRNVSLKDAALGSRYAGNAADAAAAHSDAQAITDDAIRVRDARLATLRDARAAIDADAFRAAEKVLAAEAEAAARKQAEPATRD